MFFRIKSSILALHHLVKLLIPQNYTLRFINKPKPVVLSNESLSC